MISRQRCQYLRLEKAIVATVGYNEVPTLRHRVTRELFASVFTGLASPDNIQS